MRHYRAEFCPETRDEIGLFKEVHGRDRESASSCFGTGGDEDLAFLAKALERLFGWGKFPTDLLGKIWEAGAREAYEVKIWSKMVV